MKTARVFRHLAFEDLGGFAGVLAERGYAIRYSEMGVDAPKDDADLLVILGGPIGAYQDDLYPWLKEETAVIAARLRAGRPTLGICLGAQLMARALGSKVYPGRAKEIGFAPLVLTQNNSLLEPLRDVPVLHWHGDTFDLPAGAVHLAATGDCDQQAFAVAGHALGFQFHPEAQETGFERWLIGHVCEIDATPGVTVPDLREQMRRHGALASEKGAAVLRRWLDGLT